MNDLEDKLWFQMIQRLPRPIAMVAFCAAAGSYAFFPHFGKPFDLVEFGALAAVAGFTIATRGIEKHAKRTVAAMASVEVEKARAGPVEVIRPDIPDGEEA